MERVFEHVRAIDKVERLIAERKRFSVAHHERPVMQEGRRPFLIIPGKFFAHRVRRSKRAVARADIQNPVPRGYAQRSRKPLQAVPRFIISG